MLRALGAAPHQVRRLIAGEALIVSVVAGALGLLAGRAARRRDRLDARRPRHGPPASARGLVDPARRRVRRRHPRRSGSRSSPPPGAPAARGPPRRCARPAIERARPGLLQLLAGCALPRRRRRDGADLQGHVGRLVRDPRRPAAGDRRRPARALAARASRRRCSRGRCGASAPPGCWRARAWPRTAGGRPRWRRRSCSWRCSRAPRPSSQDSGRRDTEAVTAERVAAPYVVTGRDGAPVPAPDAAELAKLPGVEGVAAVR